MYEGKIDIRIQRVWPKMNPHERNVLSFRWDPAKSLGGGGFFTPVYSIDGSSPQNPGRFRAASIRSLDKSDRTGPHRVHETLPEFFVPSQEVGK